MIIYSKGQSQGHKGQFVRKNVPLKKIQKYIYNVAFISYVVISLSKDKTSFDFGITRSKVKVISVTLYKNVNIVFAYYLENRLSQSFHFSHAD